MGYVDFEEKLIRIPPQEMKKDRDHLVPLSKQVIKQLEYIYVETRYSPYVFPNSRDSSIPRSKNVMTNRLRDLGYSAMLCQLMALEVRLQQFYMNKGGRMTR